MSGVKNYPRGNMIELTILCLLEQTCVFVCFSFTYLRLFSETEFLRWTGYSPML